MTRLRDSDSEVCTEVRGVEKDSSEKGGEWLAEALGFFGGTESLKI